MAKLDPRFERALFVSRAPDPGDRTGELVVADLRRRGVDVRFSSAASSTTRSPGGRCFGRYGASGSTSFTHAFGQNAWGSVIGHGPRAVVIAHEQTGPSRRALRPFIDRELISRFADAMIVVSQARCRMIEIERIRPSASCGPERHPCIATG